jgi:hypothetical protein
VSRRKNGDRPFFLIPSFAKFVPQSYNRAEKTPGGSHETAFRFHIFSAHISFIVRLHITTGARRGFSSSEPGANF